MKLAQIQVTGMNRDNAMSKFDPQKTFENKNIRIHYVDQELQAGSVTNEKGNILQLLESEDRVTFPDATILGTAVYKNFIIVFLYKNDGGNEIRALQFSETPKTLSDSDITSNLIHSISLYASDDNPLNWDASLKIETIVFEEASDIVKVYWIDGKNQLRSINITSDPIANNVSYKETYSFDALPIIENFGEFEIKRAYGGGEFPAGTIQYCATYINDNKAESNIIWQSPLHYITFADRAGKPNEIVNVIFNINATKLDSNFKYLRVFSILRTSSDTTPKVKCLGEFEISNGSVNITDYNTMGYEVDPFELIYKNRRYLVPQTMAYKDNTLFLGNFKYNDYSIDSKIEVDFNNDANRTIPLQTSGFCYESLLDKSNQDITYLKKGETYYLGFQVQDKYGWWSPPHYLGTYNELMRDSSVEISCDPTEVELPTPVATFNQDELSDYKRIRAVISYPNYFEYGLIAQGPLFPTIFNPVKREKGLAYAEHSWFSRPQIDYDVLDTDNWELTFPECYQMFRGGDNSNDPISIDSNGFIKTTDDNTLRSIYHKDYLFGKTPKIFENVDFLQNDKWKTLNTNGTWAEFRHYWPLPSMWHKNCEVDGSAYYSSYSNATDSDKLFTNPSILRNNYYVDRSILTLHSPDIVLSQYSQGYLDECFVHVVGDMKLSSFYHDIDIIHKQTTPLLSWIYENKLNVDKVVGKGPGLYKPGVQAIDSDKHGWKLGLAGGFWIDAPVRSNRKYNHSKFKWFDRQVGELGYFMYTIYPFQKGGCLNENLVQEADDKGNNKQEASSYSWKRSSNIRIASINTYYKEVLNVETKDNPIPIHIFNSDVDAVVRIRSNVQNNELIPYRGNQNITNLNILGASLHSQDNMPLVYVGNAKRLKTNGQIKWRYNRNYIMFPDSLESLTEIDKLSAKKTFYSVNDGFANLVLVKTKKEIFSSSNNYAVDGKTTNDQIIDSGVTYIYPEGFENANHLFAYQVLDRSPFADKDSVLNLENGPYYINNGDTTIIYPSGCNYNDESHAVRSSVLMVPINTADSTTEYTIGEFTFKFNSDVLETLGENKDYEYYICMGVLLGINCEDTGGDISDENKRVGFIFTGTEFKFNGTDNTLSLISDSEFAINNNEKHLGDLNFKIGNLKNTSNLSENLNLEYEDETDAGILTGSMVMSSGKISVKYKPAFSESEAFNSMSRSLNEIYYNYDARPTDANFKIEYSDVFVDHTCGLYDAPNSSEGTEIRAKSTAHAIINLDNYYDEENPSGGVFVLPYKGYSPGAIINNIEDERRLPIYGSDPEQSIGFTNWFDDSNQRGYGYYYIGEIRKTPAMNTAEDAIRNRVWNIGGAPVIIEESGETKIKYTAGDFYYQRFDCLNTQEWGQSELNGNVEIVSFMCETRFNLDGRYDTNRGLTSNLYANNNNFNLFNPAYTQQDNFFSYFIDKNIDKDNYSNFITWTMTKVNGEDIDSWAKIDSISTLQLDGRYGDIKALLNWNNEIVAFQDLAIAQIMYNSRTMITPSQGVPLEVANSGKVDGKTYLSTAMGCLDKWQIANSGNTLYFVDSYKNDLWSLSAQGPNPISQMHGFYSWTQQPGNTIKKVFYAQNKKDIWFNTDNTTLAFNEPMNTFVSFYDYEKAKFVINILGSSIVATENSLYLQNAGKYNEFFGEFKPFWVDMIVKDDGYSDKIFDNIEFRGEAIEDAEDYNLCPFTHIQASNEYQDSGETIITNSNISKNSNIEQKFRIWRLNIPREKAKVKGKIRNRIRSPWVRLKLSNALKEVELKDKAYMIHDFIIYYTD